MAHSSSQGIPNSAELPPTFFLDDSAVLNRAEEPVLERRGKDGVKATTQLDANREATALKIHSFMILKTQKLSSDTNYQLQYHRSQTSNLETTTAKTTTTKDGARTRID
jgi:hypothetical protein